MLSSSLDENIKRFEEIFLDCGDLVKRKIPVGQEKNIWIYISYIDMLINRTTIDEQILNPLMVFPSNLNLSEKNLNITRMLKDNGITTADLKETEELNDLCNAVLSGDTIFLADNCTTGIIISTRGWPNRGVSKTETEVTVLGAKDAFTESMRMNTMLIRRRIKDSKLKVKQLIIGTRTKTDLALMYIEDIVRPTVLEEVLNRLQSINIDGIFDSGYIAQYLDDNKHSPFPQTQITERPDKSASALLEGRIAIITDNSPFAIIVPSVFNSFMQASEDYYQGWQISSFVRLIRFTAAAIAVFLPGLYIALSVYHPSMIPTLLIYRMAGARESIPFPAFIEILIMDLSFELLREAGIRLPGAIGSTIGIVGGLIVGQAAVEAGLVSPMVVTIIALTGICGFAIPNVALSAALRLSKYFILIFSSILGILGFFTGFILILIHLVSLKSFGFPYLFPFVAGEINHYFDLRDTVFRLPLNSLHKRAIFANPKKSAGFTDDKE